MFCLKIADSALDNSQDFPVEKLDATLVAVKIFDPQYVFHIFKKGKSICLYLVENFELITLTILEDVRFMWLQPDCGIEEIPWDANTDTVLSHLETRIQVSFIIHE